jgi:hypothetical protein
LDPIADDAEAEEADESGSTTTADNAGHGWLARDLEEGLNSRVATSAAAVGEASAAAAEEAGAAPSST